MKNWQTEIKRLDKIRLELELNWNKLEQITNIDRSQLKRFFDFKNVPSMKFYFNVKDALESQLKVKASEELGKSKSCDCTFEKGLLKRGKDKCTKSKEEHNF